MALKLFLRSFLLIAAGFISYWLIGFFNFSPIYAQTCANSANIEGLISGISITGGTIGNTSTTCILDPQAVYRDFKIPTYEELENQFYALSRSTAKRTDPLPSGTNFSNLIGDGIYKQNSDMTVQSFTGSGVKIIFVPGNLFIIGNIEYADTDPYSGLVFIASGNINISSTVTKVNAVLISSGDICTAFYNFACSDGTVQTPQLVVNGGLISLNKNASLTQSIYLRRNLVNNVTQPSEVINKLSKYLYILKGGLLTKDLIITVEDGNFSITPDPGFVPPATPLPVCQVSNPLVISTAVQGVPPTSPDCIVAI